MSPVRGEVSNGLISPNQTQGEILYGRSQAEGGMWVLQRWQLEDPASGAVLGIKRHGLSLLSLTFQKGKMRRRGEPVTWHFCGLFLLFVYFSAAELFPPKTKYYPEAQNIKQIQASSSWSPVLLANVYFHGRFWGARLQGIFRDRWSLVTQVPSSWLYVPASLQPL